MFAWRLGICKLEHPTLYSVNVPLKRSRLDTTSSLARWDVDCACTSETAVVLHKRTIATHACVATVEDGRLVDIIRVGEPVPVGLGALVPALVLQGLFIRPDEVAVPGKEETVTVNTHGQVHVDSDKVIVPSLRSWRPCRIGLGWLSLKALDSLDVVLPFGLAHELPR